MFFVPAQNGTEMDVILINAGDCGTHYHVSDGSALPPHVPFVFTRAGSCTGDCPANDSAIAQSIFPDQSSATAVASLTAAVNDAVNDATAVASLTAAVNGGGAWQLSGSDLTLRKGSTSANELSALEITTGARASVNGVPIAIPTSSSEREDFTWVANF